jgi:glycosyltransferase involved in cell wall biosynthesis
MTTIMPKVTVVIPAFNEPSDVLALSLGSVYAQTFTDFECIVIDESTDPASAAACRDFCAQDKRFRYVHPESRLGLAASLNMGISLAQGELIARFDSDDVCMPNRLALQVGYMTAYPNVDVVGGGLEIISDAGKTLAFRDYPEDHATIERRFQTTTPIAHPTVMVRKHIFDRHGGYDPSFRFAEDLDLWLRLLNQGVRFANLKEVLVRYRQQNTRRNPVHWRYNLRARTRNFSMRELPMRLVGICAMAVWGSLPVGVQERVVYGLLLRRSKPSSCGAADDH